VLRLFEEERKERKERKERREKELIVRNNGIHQQN
tara:strand:+ start:409 stop:513 length:105 start_codon:yes stop_codon:yes gene_type:complete